jgi:hypothetical protein
VIKAVNFTLPYESVGLNLLEYSIYKLVSSMALKLIKSGGGAATSVDKI